MTENYNNKAYSAANHREETEAYKANSEMMEKLHGEDSFFFKPWQFSDYNIKALTLKTTYEEINIWGKQNSMFRPGFKIEEGTVFIPNIFAKVSGTHSSIKQYRKEIKFLRKEENSLFFMGFPLYYDRKLNFSKRNYFSVLNKDGTINKDKLLRAPFWKYRKLRTSLQNSMAEKIIELCTLNRFKNYQSYFKESKYSKLDSLFNFLSNFDININLSTTNDDMAKIKVFEILNNLEEPFLKQISSFDYPTLVPKILIYNNGVRYSKITFPDAVKLAFMNTMGVDIIVHNPAGYNDIEDFINEEYYDTHKLENVVFNLRYYKWFFF